MTKEQRIEQLRRALALVEQNLNVAIEAVHDFADDKEATSDLTDVEVLELGIRHEVAHQAKVMVSAAILGAPPGFAEHLKEAVEKAKASNPVHCKEKSNSLN